MTQTPKHPNATGAIDTPLAADDGRHGDDVIGIRGVAHPEKETEERHRKKLRHIPRCSGSARSVVRRSEIRKLGEQIAVRAYSISLEFPIGDDREKRIGGV